MAQCSATNMRGSSAEEGGKDVELQSYTSLQGFDMLQDSVLKHMMAGGDGRWN